MLLNFIEDYYTFKPNRQVDLSLFPKNSENAFFQSGNDRLQYLFVRKESRQIILQCHGNAANLSTLSHYYEIYEKLGLSYFVYDYPGYGNSSGKPSEESLYLSVAKAIEYLGNNWGYSLDQIILHGVSLGGAVAVNALLNNKVAAAILDCTFTSNLDMARVIFPFLPLATFLKPKFNSLVKISKIEVPVLFVAAQNDSTCPAEMSTRLYQAKPGVKDFYLISAAEHTNHLEIAGEEYSRRLQDFIAQHLK